ncbi:heterokaryon incompatibility protein-domain-containing protein [Aspergillus novoparasiticus]|uniref:Heterokaryon incompatibility protein-domain-containing protein n=1 Tax=Aspergillus novoparasiticus TaxID=986946 RepID=A0A5N6EDD0_9EURO|nr:heterokaryon incompatibility protein-domain-containing protein [Aspergillus novoparasiticus]
MASGNMEIAPSSPPIYLYSPLPEGYIRLLRLMPHQDKHAPIQCRLFDYPLHNSAIGTHRYEALSYVWGSPEKPYSILLDTDCLSVTTNLYAALLHLRDRFIERVIWIDAICINQNDLDERSSQVQFMAEIFAKASCVTVWLEVEATSIHNDKTSDEGGRALEVIQKAAEGYYSTGMDEKKAVLSLLGRSWFRRVWVLQEIAAARHILIACHSAEIDGHAFSSGLAALKNLIVDENMRDQISMVVFLIKNATLRHKRVVAGSDKFSLHIRSLADLTTMYNNREATDHRDKVYALLGMSSDNHGPGAILPVYTVSWKDITYRLIGFYIGEQACVQTWDDEDIAVIKGKGCVLGVVKKVKLKSSKDNMWDNSHNAFVTVQMTGGDARGDGDMWTFFKWPGSIKKGDIVCVLQGASKPTLIRPCGDHCTVITVGFVPQRVDYSMHGIQSANGGEINKWNGLLQSVALYPRDFLLVWEWQEFSGRLENEKDRAWLMDRRLPEHAKKELEVELPKIHRLQNLGLILVDSEKFEQALENFPQALDFYGPKAEEAYLPIFTALMNIAMSWEVPSDVEILRSMVDIARRRGDFVMIAEDKMAEIAKADDALRWMEFLFTQRRNELSITEKVLEEAAANQTCSGELMDFILDRAGPEIRITEKILLAAAQNLGYPMDIMISIFLRRENEIQITDNIFMAANSNKKWRRDLVIFLQVKEKAFRRISM